MAALEPMKMELVALELVLRAERQRGAIGAIGAIGGVVQTALNASSVVE